MLVFRCWVQVAGIQRFPSGKGGCQAEHAIRAGSGQNSSDGSVWHGKDDDVLGPVLFGSLLGGMFTIESHEKIIMLDMYALRFWCRQADSVLVHFAVTCGRKAAKSAFVFAQRAAGLAVTLSFEQPPSLRNLWLNRKVLLHQVMPPRACT